ncbi:hypothetical protein DQ354_12855 [Arthrobacter sp. AQ5-06]|nr:hypothetical protein DQ354_12855 [Arthrobacter sp. AQ5-06]
MSTKRRLGTALGVFGVAALLVKLFVKFNEAISYPDGLKVFGVALLIMAVAIPLWLAWLFRKARTFKTRLQLDHSGALIVDTFWTGQELGRFLKKGPLTPKAKGTGFILDLVADARGLQLVRQRRRPVYFGFVPWEQVVSVRMETLRRPLSRRPLLVIEIDSWNTPYVAVIRLVPSGRQNRETGMTLADRILAKRPRIPFLEDRA